MNAFDPKGVAMKKFLLAGVAALALASAPAFAADVPVKAAPLVAPVPVFSWTGCYVGIEGGGAWGHSQHLVASSDPLDGAGEPITDPYKVSGGLVGGTVGCNIQMGKVVVGAEGDLSWVSKKGSGLELPERRAGVSETYIDATKERWLGTFRGRAGYTPAPEWLIFITGGFAVAGIEASVNEVDDGVIFTDRKTQFGWTAGGGFEWAFLQNWSLKVEYLYVRLEDAVFFETPIITTTGIVRPRFVPLDDHIVRAGLNFHFWTPLAPPVAVPVKAKY
jgi:outer membrane immunogenic protein